MASDLTTYVPHQESAAHRPWRAAAIALGGTLLVLLIAGCGASTRRVSSSAQTRRATCEQVQAVLSDGPEPQADPVGYAEAQVRPLRQIRTSDTKLGQAIGRLASAYETFYASNGGGHAGRAVTAAGKAIEVICPGAAS
jgi:hypothetical protein